MSLPESGGVSETVMLMDSLSNAGGKIINTGMNTARSRNHGYFGSEHLLYGLCFDKEVVQTINDMNVEVAKIVTALDFITGKGDEPFIGPLGFEGSALKSLRLAAAFSRTSERDRIEPTDILYGVVAEGEGLAAGILESLGVDLSKIEDHMTKPGQL